MESFVTARCFQLKLKMDSLDEKHCRIMIKINNNRRNFIIIIMHFTTINRVVSIIVLSE